MSVGCAPTDSQYLHFHRVHTLAINNNICATMEGFDNVLDAGKVERNVLVAVVGCGEQRHHWVATSASCLVVMPQRTRRWIIVPHTLEVLAIARCTGISDMQSVQTSVWDWQPTCTH